MGPHSTVWNSHLWRSLRTRKTRRQTYIFAKKRYAWQDVSLLISPPLPLETLQKSLLRDPNAWFDLPMPRHYTALSNLLSYKCIFSSSAITISHWSKAIATLAKRTKKTHSLISLKILAGSWHQQLERPHRQVFFSLPFYLINEKNKDTAASLWSRWTMLLIRV